MSLQTNIIGLWSAYDYNGYGSMEDEVVTFTPDGKGWLAFERHVLCEREIFNWSVTADNTLFLEFINYAMIEENDVGFVQKASNERLTYNVTVLEQSIRWPGEEQKLTLNFDVPPVGSAKTFAFVTNDPAKVILPRFKGESD